MEESFRKLEAALVEANRTQKPYKVPLAVSKGFASFKQDMDTAYIDTFRRADERMYRDKAEYYRTHDRRRRTPRSPRRARQLNPTLTAPESPLYTLFSSVRLIQAVDVVGQGLPVVILRGRTDGVIRIRTTVDVVEGTVLHKAHAPGCGDTKGCTPCGGEVLHRAASAAGGAAHQRNLAGLLEHVLYCLNDCREFRRCLQ